MIIEIFIKVLNSSSINLSWYGGYVLSDLGVCRREQVLVLGWFFISSVWVCREGVVVLGWCVKSCPVL